MVHRIRRASGASPTESIKAKDAPGTSTGAPDVSPAGGSLPHTRAGAAWVAACGAAVAVLALLIFVAQNVHSVEVSFVMLHGRFPLAVALLAAALAGSVITLVLGSTRIVQLRRTARRFRRERAEGLPAQGPPGK